ncbi:MAG: hypothetical protein P4M08_05795 [Oligoflexia bacterium]|nr:hypothetical protein [Oligoflexia bacterium]
MTQLIRSVSVLFLAFTAVLITTNADSARADLDSVTVTTTLSGQATFQRHASLYPMVCYVGENKCERPSNQPRYYWSLVVISNGVNYELDQPLSAGNDDGRAPNEFQVGDVVIYPGERIQLTGEIQNVSSDYGIISKIVSVSVLE